MFFKCLRASELAMYSRGKAKSLAPLGQSRRACFFFMKILDPHKISIS